MTSETMIENTPWFIDAPFRGPQRAGTR